MHHDLQSECMSHDALNMSVVLQHSKRTHFFLLGADRQPDSGLGLGACMTVKHIGESESSNRRAEIAAMVAGEE